MRDIFISHVEEDFPVAQELAQGLEEGFRAQPTGFRIVRAAALGLTAIVAFWILWVLLAAVTAPSWPLHRRGGHPGPPDVRLGGRFVS
jgi:hypothetical protein